jgi:hypothetical protein
VQKSERLDLFRTEFKTGSHIHFFRLQPPKCHCEWPDGGIDLLGFFIACALQASYENLTLITYDNSCSTRPTFHVQLVVQPIIPVKAKERKDSNLQYVHVSIEWTVGSTSTIGDGGDDPDSDRVESTGLLFVTHTETKVSTICLLIYQLLDDDDNELHQ